MREVGFSSNAEHACLYLNCSAVVVVAVVVVVVVVVVFVPAFCVSSVIPNRPLHFVDRSNASAHFCCDDQGCHSEAALPLPWSFAVANAAAAIQWLDRNRG
mmetsp:Transcript_109610/g.217656  ORF Transcript_109610/g.217656 Transcript_109610/m.217656 type:complete len:101 (-) Transcript_109610:144-446(-)